MADVLWRIGWKPLEWDPFAQELRAPERERERGRLPGTRGSNVSMPVRCPIRTWPKGRHQMYSLFFHTNSIRPTTNNNHEEGGPFEPAEVANLGPVLESGAACVFCEAWTGPPSSLQHSIHLQRWGTAGRTSVWWLVPHLRPVSADRTRRNDRSTCFVLGGGGADSNLFTAEYSRQFLVGARKDGPLRVGHAPIAPGEGTSSF